MIADHMCSRTQNPTAEKLRREVVRLTSEAERLEKEVQRQKTLRRASSDPSRQLQDASIHLSARGPRQCL
jgi:hypothetical protein